MSSPQLLAQLKTAFAASKSFQAISPEDQVKILAKYASGADEEVLNALKVMAQEKVFSDELDAKETQINTEKAQVVAELKQSMKQADRLTLKDDEAAETENSDNEADKLLKQIGADKPAKRKKLFGIF